MKHYLLYIVSDDEDRSDEPIVSLHIWAAEGVTDAREFYLDKEAKVKFNDIALCTDEYWDAFHLYEMDETGEALDPFDPLIIPIG